MNFASFLSPFLKGRAAEWLYVLQWLVKSKTSFLLG